MNNFNFRKPNSYLFKCYPYKAQNVEFKLNICDSLRWRIYKIKKFAFGQSFMEENDHFVIRHRTLSQSEETHIKLKFTAKH